MAPFEVRYSRWTLFSRVALIVFLVRQVGVLTKVSQIVRPQIRVHAFFFARWATPLSIWKALISATVATLVVEVLFQVLTKPILRAWLSPKVDDTHGLFRLAASEWVIESTPARRKVAAGWEKGTLSRTNRCVWFFPADWNDEPWSVPLDGSARARLKPARAPWWTLLEGLPDRLAIAVDGETPEVFALLDPEGALPWFPGSEFAELTPIEPHAARQS